MSIDSVCMCVHAHGCMLLTEEGCNCWGDDSEYQTQSKAQAPTRARLTSELPPVPSSKPALLLAAALLPFTGCALPACAAAPSAEPPRLITATVSLLLLSIGARGAGARPFRGVSSPSPFPGLVMGPLPGP